jgi:antirestriction protein ArdC
VQTSDLYDSVTSSIIADLEKGVAPWVKSWKGGNSGGIMPINAATRRYYTGINVLILWSPCDEHGYLSPQWMTFKQAIDKGAFVWKGEKGTPVIFAKKLTFNEGDEDERKIFMHRSFPSSMSRRSRNSLKKKCPKQSYPRTRRVPLSRRP